MLIPDNAFEVEIAKYCYSLQYIIYYVATILPDKVKLAILVLKRNSDEKCTWFAKIVRYAIQIDTSEMSQDITLLTK